MPCPVALTCTSSCQINFMFQTHRAKAEHDESEGKVVIDWRFSHFLPRPRIDFELQLKIMPPLDFHICTLSSILRQEANAGDKFISRNWFSDCKKVFSLPCWLALPSCNFLLFDGGNYFLQSFLLFKGKSLSLLSWDYLKWSGLKCLFPWIKDVVIGASMLLILISKGN